MRGKPLTLLVATLAVLVLGVAAWRGWPHLRFWWLFEPLGKNAQGLPEYRHRQTGIVMVRVPGGRFWMGAQTDDPDGPNYEPGARADAKPVHEVRLSPFLIGKYEVRQTEWARVMGSNASAFHGADLPVETVAWDDCQEFCRKAGLRLPTEAQWERAWRADTELPYPADLLPVAWFAEPGEHTHPVGGKMRNAFGIYDMLGNVSEWCEDVYDSAFYSRPDARGPDPLSTSGSELRVQRGGGYASDFGDTVDRGGYVPFLDGGQDLGLRAAYWPLP